MTGVLIKGEQGNRHTHREGGIGRLELTLLCGFHRKPVPADVMNMRLHIFVILPT